MQKIVNIVALLSGVVSLGIVGGGTYAYLNKDAIIESAKEQAIKQVTASVTEALPGMIKSSMPTMPSATGNVIPDTKTNVPSVTGGVIPVK